MVIFLKVKIKDIAQMANVSISTVSRVINNSKPVNDDVRKRVLEAIKQTNYRSNVIGLETDRANTQLIGVIIPQNSNTVLDDFNVGIRDLADLYGYNIMVGLTDGSAESEQHYLKMFQRMGTEGNIFVGSIPNHEHLEIIRSSNTPCVLVGQQSQVDTIPSVHLDNITASYEAVTYLIQKGHRKIAMIRGSGDNAVGGDRYKGYLQALMDAGITLRKEWVVESAMAVEDGSDAMRRIMDSGELPTAVFCSTDWMAVGAMNHLTDNGLRVPADVAVFGFDNSFIASIVRPKLSSVEYSGTEIGMTATRTLIKLIKGETVVPHHANVAHYLAIRESTG
ncbi:LacI family transcriptional regulator [Paenibacillus sp. PastH-3]|uniref:LacI family DNA-binding transcriptional regulator n=1 Tax=unclassified Paenibacillus TaxID=185978 RepID=UPI002476A59F|nr:LacI family DNA-binding transcriptional regulator [Paenibacillus sp. PastF-4]MDH6426365.1 LacI family transcriptional regulator [Paenibacillus sp. PastH-4]MDH6442388.1 LacI family transcriptional regulator [Paenibacillus sp. PastF-4]MDH6526899.1 LacI family transcriptional regulator [Paenibacillus sp. PastH-3]